MGSRGQKVEKATPGGGGISKDRPWTKKVNNKARERLFLVHEVSR